MARSAKVGWPGLVGRLSIEGCLGDVPADVVAALARRFGDKWPTDWERARRGMPPYGGE